MYEMSKRLERDSFIFQTSLNRCARAFQALSQLDRKRESRMGASRSKTSPDAPRQQRRRSRHCAPMATHLRSGRTSVVFRRANFVNMFSALHIKSPPSADLHRPPLLLEHLLQVADFPLHLPTCFFCRPAIAQVWIPCCLARLFFHFALCLPESALDFILCARFHENQIARYECGGCNII
jgi:hypothetical protein